MKGYKTDYGWFGYIPSIDAYRLFATEEEYVEYLKEHHEY
jgi:hypothetical protein